MSTLRNTAPRRNHRERGQPVERQKWGLLEKPKDYKLRAADHRVKKRKLKTLAQKARDRNEDEFYFEMMSAESKGGVKLSKRGAEILKPEVIKLMKTQDVGYLRTVLQQTRREKGKLKEEVVTGEVGVNGKDMSPNGHSKKIMFDENGVPNRQFREDFSDSGMDSNDNEKLDENPSADPKLRALNKKRRKLQILEDRERDLEVALTEVEEQRAKSNGSIGGVSKKGVKFKVRPKR